MIEKLAYDIINNKKRLSANDDLSFFIDYPIDKLSFYSNEIRKRFRKNKINFCTIINGKGGSCSENCKFCAQSAVNNTGFSSFDFLEPEKIFEDCKKRDTGDIDWYSIVTSGKKLSKDDLEKAVKAYKKLSENCEINLCASFGLLEYEDFVKLKESGVKRCHANIETSKNYFPHICTTHTYDDKVRCIKAAKRAGLEICSGGIIGMGETFYDRIEMALELKDLDVDSIPLNVLLPIKGTPLENMTRLTEDEIIRTVCIFRFINPEKELRIAAGRSLIKDKGKRVFLSGADAAITGDMLTTTGTSVKSDIEMKKEIEKILS